MADAYDPYAIALGTLTGNPDPFMPALASSRAETTPVARGVPGPSMLAQPDFASAQLGQTDEGTPNFNDVAPSPIDPFNMARYHREPKAVPKMPLWALIATGLLDAANLRQQIKPGRTKEQIQYGHGRTRNIYTPRAAPPSSNALATLLTGHAAQKRAATDEADKYNEALDLMGLKGSMQDVLAQNEEDRKAKKSPLAQYASTNPDVAKAGALDYYFPGQGKGAEFLTKPVTPKVPAGAQPNSDYRTAALLLQQEGHTVEDPDWDTLIVEKMRTVAAMRGNPQGESNANRAAALKNELDMTQAEIKKHKARVEAFTSRIANQSAMTPKTREMLQGQIDASNAQIEGLTVDWNTKNQELANLPTKQPVTGTPRNESPTSNPLGAGVAGAPAPTVGGVESGGSSSAPAAPAPANTGGNAITEQMLTPDVIRKIQSSRDWKARAHQMFPNRPEFQ